MILNFRLPLFSALVISAVLSAVAQAQNGVPILVMADGPNGAEKANTETAAIDGTEWSEAPIVENGLTLHVLFKDPDGTGFRDAALGAARRGQLYAAFRYMAETLNADGELNVMIGVSESDGTGPLAQGGPMFAALDGFNNGTAFQRLSTGTAPFSNYAEMALTFDLGYTWHVGSDAPPQNAVDLRSVAVHEATHCLGFMSLMAADGTSRFSDIGKNTYTEFDRLLAKKPSLARLLGGSSTAPSFSGTAADLTGSAVVFDGPTAVATFGSAPPVYSSSPFQQGISLQHWAEGALPGGAVMEPRYAPGVMRREYTAVDIAVLRDIGWTNAVAPDRAPCPIQSVTIIEPSKSTLSADASNTALVHFRAGVTLDTSNPLCNVETGVLRVEFFIDGASRGVSGDEENRFPLDLTLSPGTHTVRACATRTDDSADSVEAEKTFTIAGTNVSQPAIAVTPADTVQDFGSVNAGAIADTVYTVKNTGSGTLTGAASLSGATAFDLIGNSNYSLSAGAQSTVTVRFAPDKKADFTGTLAFGGNGGNVAVTLTGAGIKTGGTLNCAGGEEAPGASMTDLLVLFLAVSALFLARLLATKQ